MMKSPNLSMPFIMPSQAQKHVTHNEAVELLDALVHLRISELDLTEPPVDPVEGQVVGIAAGATGPFEGREGGDLACHYGGGWMFVTPRNGFCAWVDTEAALYVFQDGMWRALSAEGSSGTAEGLGINAMWDIPNRLSVAAPATLLSHEGGGHQLKVNKAAETETASLIFQDAFSGRAEIGLMGADDLSLKVSADGSSWTTAFSVAAESGTISFAAVEAARIEGDAIQATPDDVTEGRLMRADWGYGPGNAVGPVSEAGGVPTGGLIESGETENGTFVRFADGTQICCVSDFPLSRVNSVAMRGTWRFPADFAGANPSIVQTLNLIRSTTSVERSDWGAVTANASLNQATVDLYLLRGAPAIPTGDVVFSQILAFGRWF